MSKQPFLGGIEYERSETLDDKLDQGTGCWNFDRRDSSASVSYTHLTLPTIA